MFSGDSEGECGDGGEGVKGKKGKKGGLVAGDGDIVYGGCKV